MWREWIDEYSPKPFSSNEEFEKETRIIGSNIGMKSPTSDSVIRISENGRIDLFASQNLGIRIDPATNAISLHASKINMYSEDTNVYTSNILGFRWNLLNFNVGAVAPGIPTFLAAVDIPTRIMKSLKDIGKQLLNIS